MRCLRKLELGQTFGEKFNIMSNLDIEIYLIQFKTFFENNPKSLIELIGNLDKETFFKRIKNVAIKNYQESDDVTLTKDQIIKIVVEMFNEVKQTSEKTINVEKVFEESYFGKICLN